MLRPSKRHTTCIILALFALMAMSCENPVDTSPNVLPWVSEVSSSEPDAAAMDIPPSACDCLTPGTWYRFSKLAVESLDEGDHPVIGTLNSLWETDIAGEELNILFEVTEVNGLELVVNGLNGARTGDSGYCVLRDTSTEVRFPLDGCTVSASAPTQFNIYAGAPAHPKNCTTTLPVKHAIPVTETILQADLEPGCGAFLNGSVPQGMLGKFELENTCTCLTVGSDNSDACEPLDPNFVNDKGQCTGCNDNYINLADLLSGFGDLEWKCQTPEGKPAACLTASFEAYRLDSAPPDCPAP